MRQPLVMAIALTLSVPRPASALFGEENLTLLEMLTQLESMYQLFQQQLAEHRQANERLAALNEQIRESNAARAPFEDSPAPAAAPAVSSLGTADKQPTDAAVTELEAAIAKAVARAEVADEAERKQLNQEIANLREQLASARRLQTCRSNLARTDGKLDAAQREHIVAQCAAVEAVNSAVLARRALEQQQVEAAEAHRRSRAVQDASGQLKAMGANY